MRTRIALVVALAAALLAGCGQAPEPTAPARPEATMTGSEPPSPRDPTPTTPGRTSPAPQPPARSKPPPTVSEGDLTVTGQLVEGVEPGCLLLRSGTTDYLLILPRHVDRGELTAAATVTVRGRLVPGLATTCQQGTPLQVSEVRPG